MVELRGVQWIAAKQVLRYLQGLIRYGLQYLSGDAVRLQGYANSNWEGNDTY